MTKHIPPAPLQGDMTNSPEDDSDAYRNWSHELNALQEIGEEALEQWRNEHPNSSRDYPPVRWLTNNGYSHLRWILREKHGMGTPEFFILLTSAGSSDKYDWHIEDVATIERANAYLADRIECRDWARSTLQTNRSQINEILRRFEEKYGNDAIKALANDPSVQSEVYDTFREIGKDLRRELMTDDSAHHYLRAAHRFFEWLLRSGRIAYDPMEGIEDEFRWDWSTDPTALTEEQVERLWIAAETDEERLLVIGYCVWGVRTKELPAVHIDQLNLDNHDPTVEFGERERKNGQGEVTLMFGFDALANILERLARDPDWNGYLIPSDDEDRSFLSAKMARKKFKDLCRKADVMVDGNLALPKHGRSFYYNVLAKAETDLLRRCGKIAEEQGASDAASVRDFYLTEEQKQKYRRVFFRDRIRQVLPEDAYTVNNTRTGINHSIDDFK